MALTNQIASAANWVRGVFKREKAANGLVSVGGTRSGYAFAGGYTAHEPFAGAWQKGIVDSSGRDPNILAFSGVYSCVTVIAQDIAKLAVRVIQLSDDGVTENVARQNPYHRLLKRPNGYQTSVDFFTHLLACRLIRGNAYAYKEFDNRGVPHAMHVLHPDRVTVLVHPQSKEIYYQYTPQANDMVSFGQFFQDEKGTFYIPARFIVHDRINTLWHPLIGTTPLFAAAMSAAMGGRIMLNSSSLFANMARPSGILTAPAEISDVVAERLKRDFEANYSAGNFGRTAVLGDGLDWKQMVITSTDAQLIEQLKWTIEDVARAYRVPMYLLNDTTRMTYKNSEQAAHAYYTGCLQYHVEALERRLTSDFGMDDETTYVAVNVDQMFRMDTSERFAAYREGIAAGVLSPNEARAREGLKPVKGGEEPRMQMQYVPLSQPVQQPAPVPAPAPEPGDEEPPTDDEEDKAAVTNEMLAIMTRVSAGAARVRFAYEGLSNEQ